MGNNKDNVVNDTMDNDNANLTSARVMDAYQHNKGNMWTMTSPARRQISKVPSQRGPRRLCNMGHSAVAMRAATGNRTTPAQHGQQHHCNEGNNTSAMGTTAQCGGSGNNDNSKAVTTLATMAAVAATVMMAATMKMTATVA